jgi:hypothetical protein
VIGPAWLNEAGDRADPRFADIMFGTIGINMHNRIYPRARNRIRSMASRRRPLPQKPSGGTFHNEPVSGYTATKYSTSSSV